MQNIHLIILFILSFQICSAQKKKTDDIINHNSIFRTYTAIFTEDPEGNLFNDNFKIKITKDKIYYTKGDETKYWFIEDLGVKTREDRGYKFHFRNLYIKSQRKHILISYDKMIRHENSDYYLLILDGQKSFVK